MSNIQLTIEEINKLDPLAIVTNDLVRSRFIEIYDTLWGAGTGEVAYERESHFFNEKLRDDEKMRKNSTKFSIFTCFIDLAIAGLSLGPGTRALCYLQGRNHAIGKDANNKNIYEGRLTLSISGYGELVMRERAGQIRHADNPVIVYEGDEFSFGDVDGQKRVNYMCHLNHNTSNILAAFLRITRSDGSIDYAVMLKEDWERLAGYSGKNNKKWDSSARQWLYNPNELYSSNAGTIDTGFLCAKLIKHAFKTYPKVRIGRGTELESQQDDNKQLEIDQFYGVEEPRQEYAAEPQPPFVEQATAGIVIDPSQAAVPEQGAEEDDGTF